MKHNDSNLISEIYDAAAEVETLIDLTGYYVHRNANNIAWLPNCIQKGEAAKYLLSQLEEVEGVRPVMGLGDSLTDHSFLTQCDFWGMPRTSQFASHIDQSLTLLQED